MTVFHASPPSDADRFKAFSFLNRIGDQYVSGNAFPVVRSRQFRLCIPDTEFCLLHQFPLPASTAFHLHHRLDAADRNFQFLQPVYADLVSTMHLMEAAIG